MSADAARTFFGMPDAAVADGGPPPRPERHHPDARLWLVYPNGKPTRGALTTAQKALLAKLALRGGAEHVSGAEVTTARRLESAGLVTLRDDGCMGPGGNWDGERWTATLTDAGRWTLP